MRFLVKHFGKVVSFQADNFLMLEPLPDFDRKWAVFPINGHSVCSFVKDIGMNEDVLDCIKRESRISTKSIDKKVGVIDVCINSFTEITTSLPFNYCSLSLYN